MYTFLSGPPLWWKFPWGERALKIWKNKELNKIKNYLPPTHGKWSNWIFFFFKHNASVKGRGSRDRQMYISALLQPHYEKLSNMMRVSSLYITLHSIQQVITSGLLSLSRQHPSALGLHKPAECPLPLSSLGSLVLLPEFLAQVVQVLGRHLPQPLHAFQLALDVVALLPLPLQFISESIGKHMTLIPKLLAIF